jgi:hypothetical protein
MSMGLVYSAYSPQGRSCHSLTDAVSLSAHVVAISTSLPRQAAKVPSATPVPPAPDIHPGVAAVLPPGRAVGRAVAGSSEAIIDALTVGAADEPAVVGSMRETLASDGVVLAPAVAASSPGDDPQELTYPRTATIRTV